jgi:3-hydroxybutyryl-CoA dehydrogenase
VAEAPGFVCNRLLIPMINEAVELVYTGVASPEDIDTAMKLGCNHPMGPLTLGDFIGLDTCLAIMETIYAETGDSKYRPSLLLRKMVRAGKLGNKTGEGFFKH